LTVFNKVVIKGIIYNSWEIKKVISCQIINNGDLTEEFDVVDLEENDKVDVRDEEGQTIAFDKFIYKRKVWCETHAALIKKICKCFKVEEWEITDEKKEVKR